MYLILWSAVAAACHFEINVSGIMTIIKKKKKETHEAIVAAVLAGKKPLHIL